MGALKKTITMIISITSKCVIQVKELLSIKSEGTFFNFKFLDNFDFKCLLTGFVYYFQLFLFKVTYCSNSFSLFLVRLELKLTASLLKLEMLVDELSFILNTSLPSQKTNIKNKTVLNSELHPFHLVGNSPWPLFTSLSTLTLCSSLISFMSYIEGSYDFIVMSFLGLLLIVFSWFSDIGVEATYKGYHTKAVQRGLTLSVILFILSEIMFFFSFFWAFFHSSLAPSIFIGGVWPPKDIQPLHTGYIPLLNTIILLFSGVTVTTTHKLLITYSKLNSDFYLNLINSKGLAVKSNKIKNRISFLVQNKFVFKESVMFLLYTLFLALLFTYFQKYEYSTATFSINDSIYGSIFFLITGFHGFHVIIGTFMILVQFFKLKKQKVQVVQHIGFESASWYWHFVDIVWLFLVMFLYFWSSKS